MDLTGVADFFGIEFPFIKELKSETLIDLPARYRPSSRAIEGKCPVIELRKFCSLMSGRVS